MNEQTQLAQMTPQQRQAIAKAKARLRLQQQGQPAAPANGARDLEAERASLIAGEDQRRQSQVEAVRAENYRSAPNPIIAAQRQSQVDAGNAFAESKKPYDMVGAVASDVGKFVKTSPLNAVNAVVGAVEGTANIPSDLINSARLADARLEVTPEMAMRNANRMPMMQQRVGKAPTPAENVPMLPRADLSAARMQIAPEDQSITGMLAEGLGQFVAARVGIGKLAPGGGMTSQLGKDVAATGVAFAGGNGRVADMVDLNAVPEGTLRDYVRWLKTQPGDDPILGRIKNMSEDATLNMLLVGLGRTAKAGYNAATGKGAPLTPTNAGGAPNARPVAPPQAPAQPVAQAAPQPSVAPVVPQAAPRAAQAGPAGAGQQPPVSPPTLNAVPTTPAVPKQQMLVARDTAKILTRIMRAANVKNADIRGYLPGAVQRYKSLNDSRVPFAFFLEGDLPKHFAEPVAADVVTKLQGWGRARNAAMGTGDKSAQITQGTIKELRGSQQDFLTKSAEANLYKGSLISQEDQILKSLRETGRKGYEPSLDYARQAIDGRRKPSAAEAQAVDDLRQILARPTLQKYVDDATRIRAEKDGIDIDQLIKDDPIGSAHWLQSEFRRLSDASEDALTGKPTRTSGAYDDLREMILDPLKRASPGYEGAMMRFGHDFGSKEAVTFGKGIFTASRGAYDTAQKIRKFKKLGRRQQTVAWKSIRDEFLNEFRGTPEDAAAKLTRMQQEGALDLLEQMGARGKRFADDIRRIAQQENPSIRAIEQASNSLTFKNLSGAEAAREMVQSPINQVVGSVTDKASWPMTLAADAMVMGTTGIPAPMLTASKLMDKFGNPGPQTLSRATEGLYGLPSKASGSTPELLKASRGGGGGRPKGGAPQVEQDIGALLKALDEVEADPKRRGGPEGKRLLNQIAAAQGGKPAKPKRQKVTAAPATGLGGPASPAAASPDATGLGTSSAKPPAKNGVNNIIAGGITGSAIGTFGAGEADAQTPETAQKIADNDRLIERELGQIADFESALKIFSDGTPEEIQAQLDSEGFDLGPTGIDGTLGDITKAAIRGRKEELNANLKTARDRLATLEGDRDKLKADAAFERTRPTEDQLAFRDYAPLLGGIAGATGAKLLRVGGTTVSKFTAKNAIKKADALLNNAPISPPKTVQDRAEIRKRATNVNEFWQRGGSKTKVPFETKRDGTWIARPPKDVMPPSGLFPDKFIGRKVGAMDALIGGSAATEAVLAGQNAEMIKEKLATAYEALKDDKSEENYARVQELEDQYAQAKGLMMLGIGAGIGTGIGVMTSKYASKRANVPKAEEELAILRDYFANQKKPPPKATGKSKKAPSSPPLPPSRPRRNQRPPNP